MYTLYLLKGLAPFVGGMCLNNLINKQENFCNLRQTSNFVVKYDRPNPEHACYRDGIFYPRCKDLENPEVMYYHNLLKNQ